MFVPLIFGTHGIIRISQVNVWLYLSFFLTRGDFAWQLSLKCISKVELLHGDLRKSISTKLINVIKIKDIEILLCSVSVMCW